ncbi:MAG: L-serine ammonia-lyase, iron-sulfur-dependent, subunit alpha, partial [Ancalomicrobiaceae bacterium]|nr:L-serine ammonia-lyase, iron-sulfur-dependent, subunit alpha [Ancalomicrobiaceae bacterium]
MRFSEFLRAEWNPALGCTEPAAIAWAAALAAKQGTGPVKSVRLICDGRTYKNCYAVHLPKSENKTGILWTLAIGANLPDPSLGLQVFEQTDSAILASATELMSGDGVSVEVDADQAGLHIDCTVVREDGVGRAVLAREHTRLVRLEANGRVVGGEAAVAEAQAEPSLRAKLAQLSFGEMVDFARTMSPDDREALRKGADMNIAIARHGLSMLPSRFAEPATQDCRMRISNLVCAGVFARMNGEPYTVMSLAGSGNKGITVSVPVMLWGQEGGYSQERVDEALGLACVLTSATTYQLGTLSAICGCSNAAGLGIAAAMVMLEGGGAEQIGLAVSNMVGNVAGMICDGAKMGCALKVMTAADAAFHAASLALSGIGVPTSDGIVGATGEASLSNLGRLAQRGMASVDTEILNILQSKLKGG